MSITAPAPAASTTLVIILGASTWPNSPGFHASKAFLHAARGFKDYMLDPYGFGLPVVNLLDLFNAPTSSSDQLEDLGSFLEERVQAQKAVNQEVHDVLVYFVGHGGFVGPSADFYLMHYRANASSLRSSGIAIEALAEVLREKTRQTRRYLFLDCCFAAAAFRAFQGGPDQTAITKTMNAFSSHARSHGFPRKGTVLLCSSDHTTPSLLLPDESCTMFSHALLDVLRNGDPHRPLRLSLRDIKELTEDRLVALPEKNAPRPGLYSPDQSEGDVADVAFFPNPHIEEKQREVNLSDITAHAPIVLPVPPRSQPLTTWIPKSPELPVASRSAEASVLPHNSALSNSLIQVNLPSLVTTPSLTVPPVHPHHMRSRKNLLVLWSVLLVLLIGVTGVFLRTISLDPIFSPQGTTITQASGSTITASINAYEHYVAKIGIQPGFDAQSTRTNPYEKILNSLTVSRLEKAWTFPADSPIESSPVVVNGVVYVGSNGQNLYAIDAASGDKKWSFPAGASIISSPAVVNGVVYVGSNDQNLYAIDAASGNKKWSFPTAGSIISSPVVVNGVVYVGSNDQNLYAIDAASGSKKWSFPTDRSIVSSPAVANGVVYVSSDDQNLYAIDAASGSKKWSFPTAGPIDFSPAVADGVVYVGSNDQNLYAIDAVSGDKKWSFPTDRSIVSSPAVANGVVYVGSNNQNLYAIDAASGNKKWSFLTDSYIESSPAVANGVVYVGSYDHSLYAFHLSK